MDKDFSSELIEQYTKKHNLIKQNLKTQNLFPNRQNPLKTLAPSEDFLLKATYELRVGFLSEFSFLFAYIYSKQKFEASVLSLEKQGYIKSETSKDYGKYWVLTAASLFYLETDQSQEFKNCNLKDNTFPSANKLAYYKSVNGFFCQKVFRERTSQLMALYHSKGRDFRTRYSKEQFIKAYLFGSSETPYNKEAANAFVLTIWDEFEQNEELKAKYKRFVKDFKENEKKQFIDHALLQFAFLKDFYNSLHLDRKQTVKDASDLFFHCFQTVFKSDQILSRICLFQSLDSNGEIKKDLDLFYLEELFLNLSMVKRNLSKAVPTSEDEALLLSEKLDSLEKRLALLQESMEQKKEDFEVMVFDKMVDDIASFKSCVITLKTLSNIQCHLIGFEKGANQSRPQLIWGIFQPNGEEFSVSSLFSRIEKIYQYQFHHLQMTDFKMVIITHTDSQKKVIETKLETVKDSFEELGHYGLLLYHLDELKVFSTQLKRKERFEIFNEFAQKAKFLCSDKKD